MVLNESDCNVSDDFFYSPISATGYLTPLQRKIQREKRNTPVTCLFADDFKTPKSSTKSTKKPKRPVSSKPKAKPKTPKEQGAKSSKENLPELRYSVASLVNQGTSDGTVKEKRFFKNRSPQHLQKTEFVMPLSYKKRSLDFSSEKKNLLPLEPTKQNSTISPNILASKENKSNHRQPTENVSNSPITTTPKHKMLTLKDESDVCQHPEKVANSPVNTTPKRKMLARKEQSPSPQNQENFVTVDLDNTDRDIDVTPKRKVLCSNQKSNEAAEPSKDSTEFCFGGDIFNFEWPSDEDLLKRQNEARAILKKALMVRNNETTAVQKVVVSVSDVKTLATANEDKEKKEASPKLYPIFNNVKVSRPEAKAKDPTPKKPSQCIRDTSRGEDQMIIDAGQREIGSRLCKTCNMLYAIGHEEDERLHMAYHDTYLISLKFPGWKNECIVGDFDDGRVIKIVDTHKSFMLKKVQDVLNIANRDLGFSTSSFPSRPNIMFFLFISNDKRVGGCLVAESIESACPVVLGEESGSAKNPDESPVWKLGNWYASNKPVKAICGVNRIWVAKEFRRQKIASRLIDCLRGCFIYGHVVDCREMAFTDPSPDGRVFAAAYTGTDNFLVYK